MADICVENDRKRLGIDDTYSKSFDFETMCVINDALSEKCGILRAGFEGVKYLFHDTSVSSKTINALGIAEKAKLSEAVTDWYLEEIIAARKNK